MSSDVHTLRMDLKVEDCGIAYLHDEDLAEVTASPYPSGSLVGTARGIATLAIATQWGAIPFTVSIADRDPGADLDGYEDIVEADFDSPSGKAFLIGWCMDEIEDTKLHLPPLPVGPGTYRLRYHLRGMDEERCAPNDHYLQIWPAPNQGPAILKATSTSMHEILKA